MIKYFLLIGEVILCVLLTFAIAHIGYLILPAFSWPMASLEMFFDFTPLWCLVVATCAALFILVRDMRRLMQHWSATWPKYRFVYTRFTTGLIIGLLVLGISAVVLALPIRIYARASSGTYVIVTPYGFRTTPDGPHPFQDHIIFFPTAKK